MKIGNILATLFLIGTCAALAVSPYSIPAAMETLDAEERIAVQEAAAQQQLSSANASLVSAVSAYNESRTFDIYYGDITKVGELLNGTAGISVKSLNAVDPMNHFQVSGPVIQDDTQPACVQCELVVEDITTALAVLERMELPVYSIYMEYPNTLTVVFMSGGDV